MNISTKFQRHPPYSFWGEDFLTYFRKFSVLVAMATNFRDLDKIHIVGTGPLKEQFCKVFVKISAMR